MPMTVADLKDRIRTLEARVRELEAMARCVRCGKPVEDDRRCYAIPHCHACLPPPTPLECPHDAWEEGTNGSRKCADCGERLPTQRPCKPGGLAVYCVEFAVQVQVDKDEFDAANSVESVAILASGIIDWMKNTAGNDAVAVADHITGYRLIDVLED